jgi:uncharacterized protein (TIGR03083 family)
MSACTPYRAAAMGPAEHLEWARASVLWLLQVPVGRMGEEVGNCPGWTIGTLFDHLARGLGRGYAAMVQVDPSRDAAAVMGAALAEATSGAVAYALFHEAMPAFLALLAEVPPDRPCATYAGPGTAAFWRRKAAVELAVHATDVADALSLPFAIAPRRALDGIDETVTFALPLALTLLGVSMPPVLLRASGTWLRLGTGEPVATITGDAPDVLLGLYGRRQPVLSGDRDAAAAWLGLIGAAF